MVLFMIKTPWRCPARLKRFGRSADMHQKRCSSIELKQQPCPRAAAEPHNYSTDAPASKHAEHGKSLFKLRCAAKPDIPNAIAKPSHTEPPQMHPVEQECQATKHARFRQPGHRESRRPPCAHGSRLAFAAADVFAWHQAGSKNEDDCHEIPRTLKAPGQLNHPEFKTFTVAP